MQLIVDTNKVIRYFSTVEFVGGFNHLDVLSTVIAFLVTLV